MRKRRRRTLLLAVPLFGLATGGVVYMASNDVPPTYAGASTYQVSCTATPHENCTTTPTP